MHFTSWPSAKANEGTHGEISWESFVDFVAKPVIAADKSTLKGWSPAKFTGDRRGKAYVELVSALVLDDDASGLTTDALAAKYASARGVIHTSHSHTLEHPKHRIALDLSRDVTTEEHAQLSAIVTGAASEGGQSLDTSTRDSSRLWYVPAHREGATYEWRELTGKPLDVDAILAAAGGPDHASAAESLDRGHDLPASSTRLARAREAAAALGASWPAKKRHEAQLSFAGALRAEGFAADEALELLCLACRVAGDEDREKRRATIAHTYGLAEDAAMTSWTRLSSLVDPAAVDRARAVLARDAVWTEATNRRLAEVAARAEVPAANDAGVVEVDGLRFKTGGLDAPLPAIPYQVGTFIARGEIVMLVAQGNSLKTWLAFSVAHAVASGRPWLGQFPVLRGRVGILDFESGDYEVARRLKLLGVKDGDVGDRLLRCSYPGDKLDLAKPESWVKLAALKLDLLVWDSFAAASRGQDENDKRAADMLQLAGEFAEHTRCTVNVIHHARKGSGGDEREQVRGSTALYAACDRVYAFDEPEKRDDGVVLTTMKTIKDGAGRRPPPVRVELSDSGGLRYVEALTEDAKAGVSSIERNRALVIQALRERGKVAKADLLNIMKGKTDTKREQLSQMVIGDIVREHTEREGKTSKSYIRLGQSLPEHSL